MVNPLGRRAKVNELTKAILSRKHPDYDDYLDQWDMFEDTYKGGRQWFQKHIHRYHKEGNDEFKTRVERAVRFNHPKEIVDLVGKYLFRASMSRKEDAPQPILEFWKSMSKRGWPAEEYLPVLNKWSSIFGRIWVVIDATRLNADKSMTQAEIKKMGYRVWSYWVKPQDMMDCEWGDDGQLNWILLREHYRVDSDLGENGNLLVNGGIRQRYRLWTRNTWVLYEWEVDGSGRKTNNLKESDSHNHNLGLVPVLPLDNMNSSEDYVSESLISDIAYLDRAVANYISCLDAIIQDQTFSQLAMPAQAAMFNTSVDDGDEELKADKRRRENMLEMGKKRIFMFDGESKQAPFFLSPDPKQAELIIKAIRQLINEIYHSVGVAGERTKQDNAQGIDNSSGVAKAYDFDRINSLLVNKGKALERFENNACRIVMAWHGENDTFEEQLVTYPDSFDVRSFSDELNISERLAQISAPLQVRQYQMKIAVRKLYPFMDKADWSKIEKSIDDMDDILDLLSKGPGENVMSDALPNEQNQDDEKDE